VSKMEDWLKIDLHVHTTKSSDGLSTINEVIRVAKNKGLNGLAITDHDVPFTEHIDNFLIIPGVEISTNYGHLIGLGLTVAPKKGINIWEAIDFIREHDGIIVIPHPFDRFRSGINDIAWKIPAHAVEVINAGTILNSANKKAEFLANKRNLGKVAGSDAHMAKLVGFAYTLIKADPDVDSILKAIANKRTKPCGKTYGVLPKVEAFIKRQIRKIR